MSQSSNRRGPLVVAAVLGAAAGGLIAFFVTLTLLGDSFVDTAAFNAATRLQFELTLLADLRAGQADAARVRLETRIREGALHLEAVRPSLSGETRMLVDKVLADARKALSKPKPADD